MKLEALNLVNAALDQLLTERDPKFAGNEDTNSKVNLAFEVLMSERKTAVVTTDEESPKEDIRVGTRILYSITAKEAQGVMLRRVTGLDVIDRIRAGTFPHGAQACTGAQTAEGYVYPGVITYRKGSHFYAQVWLNGSDTLWVPDLQLHACVDVDDYLEPGKWCVI